MKKILRIVLLVVLALTSLGQPTKIMAEEKEVQGELPVRVDGPEGTIVVEAWPDVSDPYTNDGPLPNPSSMTFTGEETFYLPFTDVGNYVYKVYQKESGETEDAIYDETFYKIYVLVTYDAEGNLEYAMEAMTNGSEKEKPAEICFVNEEVIHPTPTPTATPAPSESPKPTIVPSPTPTPKSKGKDAPYTSDNTNLMMYGGILLGALVIVGILLKTRSKN